MPLLYSIYYAVRGIPLLISLTGLVQIKLLLGTERRFYIPNERYRDGTACASKLMKKSMRSGFRPQEIAGSGESPLFFGIRSRWFFTTKRSAVLIYYRQRLDKVGYRACITDAKWRLDSLSKKSAAYEKWIGLRNTLVTVVITDSLEGDLEERAKKTFTLDCTELVPCIYDVPENRVYMRGAKIVTDSDMARGQRLVGRLLFGGCIGKIPRKGNPYTINDSGADRMKPVDKLSVVTDEIIDMFYLEGKKRDQKIAKMMHSGEIRREGSSLYYCKDGKVMALPLLEDNGDDLDEEQGSPRTLVWPPEVWYYPRSRKLSKNSVRQARAELSVWFSSQTDRYEFDDLPNRR